MADLDSDLDSYISSKSQRRMLFRGQRRNKAKENRERDSKMVKDTKSSRESKIPQLGQSTSLETIRQQQAREAKELADKSEAMRNDMLLQCKVNECRYEGYVDKKKRAKMIEAQVLGMNQEVILMQKQIERRVQKAHELKQRAEMAQHFNDVRKQWQEKKTKFKEDLSQLNKEQVRKGIKKRHVSEVNKKKLVAQMREEKHRMYLELKNRAQEDELRKKEDVGSVMNQKVLQAKENKIAEEKGKIIKKSYTKRKIDELSSQISFRIKSKEADVKRLKSSMDGLVKSQGTLRKQLQEANSGLSRERERARKMKVVSDHQEKLLQKPSYTYNFDRFEEKARMAEFLLQEDRRRQKDLQKEETFVKRNVEMSLRIIESLPSLEKGRQYGKKEISYKY